MWYWLCVMFICCRNNARWQRVPTGLHQQRQTCDAGVQADRREDRMAATTIKLIILVINQVLTLFKMIVLCWYMFCFFLLISCNRFSKIRRESFEIVSSLLTRFYIIILSWNNRLQSCANNSVTVYSITKSIYVNLKNCFVEKKKRARVLDVFIPRVKSARAATLCI